MENCVIDFNHNIIIPQNETKNFNFFLDKKWSYCTMISFDVSTSIDYLNLYLILQSYAHTKIYPVFKIATFFYDKNSKIAISRQEGIKFIKKMNFEHFMEWFDENLIRDWEYEKDEESGNVYGFMIIFEKKLSYLIEKKYKIEIASHVKPNYPWTLEWTGFFKKSFNEYTLVKKENEILKNRIKQLEKKNKELEESNKNK